MEDSGIDSGDPKPTFKNEAKVFVTGSDSSCGSNGSIPSPPRINNTNNQNNSTQGYTSKQLQRRLEARIENARKLHRNQEYKNTPSLIPIQRLSIPGGKEQQPLVEWDTEDSEEDVVNFFPISRTKDSRQQDLTDTFSIEEMSVSGCEEDEEDLHLVPPTPVYKRFGCCGLRADKCIVM